jgi:malate permease and related proteins
MGVLLTAAAIVVSTAVGVWSEHRWPRGAAEGARRALLVILYVVLPPAYFLNLASAHIDLDEGVGILLALVSNAATAVLVWWVATRFLRLARHQVGAVVIGAMVVNTAFLGFPLTISLLGRDHLSNAVLYDVLVSGPLLLLGAFAVGAAFGTKSGERPRDRVRAFFTRNPPLYGAVLGLLAPRSLAPETLVHIAQVAVIGILPIGFFAVGATLAEDAEEGTLPMPPPLTRPVALALAGRLVVAPALLMALAAPLIDLPSTYRLLIAMPTGLNALIVSHAYGLDNRTVAETVTWSTAIVILVALVSLLF